jgi:DNA-binding MarR family transcriptional regulator
MVAVSRQPRAKTRAAEHEDGSVTDPIAYATSQWLRERPDLDPSPMAVFGRIARIFALQRRAQSEVHEPLGLSHAAFDVLANLRRSGKPHRKTATSLAASSMISTGGVTFRMDGLEAAGLIRRVRDADDRRVVYAELTDKGFALIDKAIEAHLEMEHALLAGLTERERHQLSKLLSKVEASLTEHVDRIAQ